MDGVRGVHNEHKPNGVSSVAFNYNIPKSITNVKSGQEQKGVATQSVAAHFVSKGTDVETTPFVKEKDGMRIIGANNSVDEKAFVDGLWGREESHNNENAANVEKSQLENVENFNESSIIKETVDNDTGVPGEYTDEIVWQHRKVPVRKSGEGYRGKRTRQHNQRVDAYELKVNPDDESYFLIHPDGIPVQFENMNNGIVQDCKLVMSKNSIYYVKEKIPVLNLNILKQARRQLEAANLVGYKVEWLISDQKAVEQMRQLFNENNLDIIVTFYPE